MLKIAPRYIIGVQNRTSGPQIFQDGVLMTIFEVFQIKFTQVHNRGSFAYNSIQGRVGYGLGRLNEGQA